MTPRDYLRLAHQALHPHKFVEEDKPHQKRSGIKGRPQGYLLPPPSRKPYPHISQAPVYIGHGYEQEDEKDGNEDPRQGGIHMHEELLEVEEEPGCLGGGLRQVGGGYLPQGGIHPPGKEQEEKGHPQKYQLLHNQQVGPGETGGLPVLSSLLFVRGGEALILADPPEVEPQQGHKEEGEEEQVKGVEAEQGLLPHLPGPQQEKLHLFPYEGGVRGHLAGHGDSPEGE